MNRFVKDNIILVISIGATCLVALGLLVYGIIEWVRISELITETDGLRNKIKTLNRATPAPVEENKPLIISDTEEYAKLYNQLTPVFDSPFRQSRDAFLRVLYNLKDTDNIDEAAQKFLETYNERVMSAPNPTAQRMQWDKWRGELANWDAAANAFRETAVKAGIEREQLDKYINDVVLERLGVPRRMNEDATELQRFLNDSRAYLRERLGERFAGNETFGLNTPNNGFAKSDYPLIARHTTILNDLIGRIADSKIESYNGIVIRGANGETLDQSFSEENGCRISHYTFEVTGSLEAIRDLAARFDTAQKDKRFYIVRSVFLYGPASENAMIKSLIKPAIKESESAEAQPQQEQSGGLFGVSRRARLAQARQMEAKQREEDDEKKRSAAAEAMRKREESLPPHERHGYGEVVLGDVTSFTAVIDVDYIERI
jgi:hypothetical protein